MQKNTELFVTFLGYKIYCGSKDGILNIQGKYIATINPHSAVVAESDNNFRRSLVNADFLIPDGIGIVWAISFFAKRNISQLTGPEMMDHALQHANKKKLKVFFLGSTNEVLDSIKIQLKMLYPNIISQSLSPPFKEELTIQDDKNIIKEINKFEPDYLFIGMTAPKQEKWAFKNKSKIHAKKIFPVGAAFDWFSGSKTPPSNFAKKYNMISLERFIREPRIWKRIFISIPKFILLSVREWNR